MMQNEPACDVCAASPNVLLLDVSTGARLCRPCAEAMAKTADHYRKEHPHGATINGTVLGT